MQPDIVIVCMYRQSDSLSKEVRVGKQRPGNNEEEVPGTDQRIRICIFLHRRRLRRWCSSWTR